MHLIHRKIYFNVRTSQMEINQKWTEILMISIYLYKDLQLWMWPNIIYLVIFYFLLWNSFGACHLENCRVAKMFNHLAKITKGPAIRYHKKFNVVQINFGHTKKSLRVNVGLRLFIENVTKKYFWPVQNSFDLYLRTGILFKISK